MSTSNFDSLITNALATAGIDGAVTEVVKNGVVCTGFRINNGSIISPVVYYSEGETVEAFVEKVRKIAEQPTPEIDIRSLISRDSLLENSYLCLQKKSCEDIVKWDFLNLEMYARIAVGVGADDSIGSVKINQKILDQAGLMKEELFDAARKNSVTKARICSMAEALGMPEELFGDVPMYVGTYSDKIHGAAVMALPDCIHSFCLEKDFDRLYILPSSTQEILLVPVDSAEPEVLASMVHEVNESEVEPALQFDAVVYEYVDEIQEVSIAASYERGC